MTDSGISLDTARPSWQDLVAAEENLVIGLQFLVQGAMADHGWSLADVARRSGIRESRLRELKQSSASPTLREAARLLRACGRRPGDLEAGRKT